MDDEDLRKGGDFHMTCYFPLRGQFGIREFNALWSLLRILLQNFLKPLYLCLYFCPLLLRFRAVEFLGENFDCMSKTALVAYVVINILFLEMGIKAFIQRC